MLGHKPAWNPKNESLALTNALKMYRFLLNQDGKSPSSSWIMMDCDEMWWEVPLTFKVNCKEIHLPQLHQAPCGKPCGRREAAIHRGAAASRTVRGQCKAIGRAQGCPGMRMARLTVCQGVKADLSGSQLLKIETGCSSLTIRNATASNPTCKRWCTTARWVNSSQSCSQLPQ